MMEYLGKFEEVLENESTTGQQMLRMLLFASQDKVCTIIHNISTILKLTLRIRHHLCMLMLF